MELIETNFFRIANDRLPDFMLLFDKYVVPRAEEGEAWYKLMLPQGMRAVNKLPADRARELYDALYPLLHHESVCISHTVGIRNNGSVYWLAEAFDCSGKLMRRQPAGFRCEAAEYWKFELREGARRID